MDTETISIFIAAAKNLVDERRRLKALTNDLNSTNKEKGIQMVTTSYENLESSQIVYNDFIHEEADIVLFILDGKIGRETEGEFLTAVQTRAEFHRPEVLVFVKPHDEEGRDFGYIQGLMKASMNGQYYNEYKNLDELETRVRNCLNIYINKRLSRKDNFAKDAGKPVKPAPETVVTPALGKIRSTRGRWGWIVSAILCAVIGLLILPWDRRKDTQETGMVNQKVSNESHTILFVGGGSAVNFLKQEVKIDVDTCSNAMMVRLGSGSAWSVLAEDANLVNLSKTDPLVKHKYVPVCVSAGRMDESIVESILDVNSLTKLYIIEWKIGEDPLCVYVNSDLFNTKIQPAKWFRKGSTLTPAEFAELLKIKDISVFATSPKSGTLQMYKTILDSLDSPNKHLLDSMNLLLYNESSYDNLVSSSHGATGNDVFLSSEYYYWKGKNAYTKLNVAMPNGTPFKKDIYVYFPAYRHTDFFSEETLVVPDIIRSEILEKLKNNKKGDEISEALYVKLKEGKGVTIKNNDLKPVVSIKNLE